MEFQTNLQVDSWTPGSYLGSRPLQVNKNNGLVLVNTERGLTVNSQLRRDEWQRLDAAVQEAAVTRLNAVADLKAAGLVEPIGSFGTLTSQWSQQSELSQADVSMTGQSVGERGRLEMSIAGQPVPVVFKDFMIPARQLEASRMMANPLDVTHAIAATRVVSEKLEAMLVNGDTSVVFDGNTLYGYTSEPNRNTDTATNYGGGDWGTSGNAQKTIAGMVNAAHLDRYYGPYVVYASTTQYLQAVNTYYTDGSGDTEFDRILAMPMISGMRVNDTLADGNIVLVSMQKDVVDWAEHRDISVVEWMSGDGMATFFKVMAVATPRVKSDYNNRSGIVHATGA